MYSSIGLKKGSFVCFQIRQHILLKAINNISRSQRTQEGKNRISSMNLCTVSEEKKSKHSILLPPNLPLNHGKYGRLVYAAPLSSRVKAVKVFSIVTSIFGLAMQPVVFSHANSLPVVLKFALTGGVSFFVLGTPLLLHWLTKRYVLHMYYNEDKKEFSAALYNIFAKKNYVTFSVDDVQFSVGPDILNSIFVHKKPMMFDPECFLVTEAYIRLMKYDKPLEWELKQDLNEVEMKKKTK